MDKPEFIAFQQWGRQLADLTYRWTHEEIVENATTDELHQLWSWLQDWNMVVTKELIKRATKNDR